MVIFHRYFIFKTYFENDLDKYLTCTACILLSSKACNQLCPLEDLVKYFLKLYIKQFNIKITIDDKLIFETSEKICSIEFYILQTIDFDLNVELPYKYIQQMGSYYRDSLKNPKLIIITTNFISDSFKLPLCLYYDPLYIALACLYLASFYFKVRLLDNKDGLKWFQLIDKNVQIKEVITISEQINKIYKFFPPQSSNQNAQIVSGKPIIKFESARILSLQEKIIESNLDVIEDFSGINEKIDFNNPCLS
jgi:hypothetical protein